MQHYRCSFFRFSTKTCSCFFCSSCACKERGMDEIECVARNCWAISAEITKRRTSLNSDMSLTTWLPGWAFGVSLCVSFSNHSIPVWTAKGTGGLQPLCHVQKGKATCISVRYLCWIHWIHTADLGTASNYIQQVVLGLLQCLIDYEL